MTTLVLNQIPRFPARVGASNGLTAVVENGVDVMILPSFGDLVSVPAVTKPASTYFMAWDKEIDYYQSISFDQLSENLAERVLGNTITAQVSLAMAANQAIYFTSPTAAAAYDLSSFVRGISGSVDAPAFRTAIGLGNVNNTSDANKPVSALQQTALNLKADLASPTFTGDPKAPTPAPGDNDTSIATTAFVTSSISAAASTKVALLQDQKASGTPGGSSVVGWQTRTLNTEVIDPDNIVTLSGNAFTTTVNCWLDADCEAFLTTHTILRIWNVTDNVEVNRGVTQYSGVAAPGWSVLCRVQGLIQAGKSYRLEMYAATAQASTGLGTNAGQGTEVYCSASLRGLK